MKHILSSHYNLSFFTFFCLCLAILILPANVARAEYVAYPSPGLSLQTISGVTNSLGPSNSYTGKSFTPYGNEVVLNYATVSRVVGGINILDGLDVTNNVVTIKGSVEDNVYGGFIGDNAMNSVTNNKVVLDIRSTVYGQVYGGFGENGDANNNRVEIIEQTAVVMGDIYGGASTYGRVNGNTLLIKTGYLYGSAFGGTTVENEAVGNMVEMSGGRLAGQLMGGGSINGLVTGNTVSMSGNMTVVAEDVTGGLAGGSGLSRENSASMSGGTIGRSLYGGYSENGNAENNTATLNDGLVMDSIHGGFSESKDATGNSVAMTGGTVDSSVFGGYSSEGNVEGNSVTITGGKVGTAVYGGYSLNGNATDNTVNIEGAPDLSEAGLYGGKVGGTSGVSSGNTLNMRSANMDASAFGGFQNLNFYLPTTMGNGGKMLTVSGKADITGSTVNVAVNGASSPLKAGDKVVLIDAGTLVGTPLNNASSGQAMQGVTLKYDFIIETANNLLTARLLKEEVNEGAKALSMALVSDLILIRQTAELVAGQAMSEAVNAALQADSQGLGAFGALSGGWSRYETGSHVDMSSVSLLAGLSWGTDLTPGRLTLGAFFEYGNGSYDTYNSFVSVGDIDGDGKTYHLGGGVLARMDFNNSGPGRFYAEGSLRAGGVHNDYGNSGLRDIQGRIASYDYSSPYYGLHVGAGYIWNITDTAWLDLYGKYFWTHREGESVQISTGETLDFDNANSHRVRVGGRLFYALHERVSPYLGAAYEYEFDGKVSATSNGYELSEPDLRGSTGIGELGLSFKPAATLPLFFDLGVQGYVGAREGVTGSLHVKWEF